MSTQAVRTRAPARRDACGRGGDYCDLRLLLPGEFRRRPNEQLPALWAAWHSARASYSPDHLVRQFHVSDEDAARLVGSARDGRGYVA